YLAGENSLRGKIAAQSRYRFLRIELVSDRCVRLGFVRREEAAGMQIVGRRFGTRQRPFLFIAPMATDKNPAFGSLMAIAAAHHVNADRRLAIYAIVDMLQNVIEPAQLKGIQIDGGIRSELRFSGVADIGLAVNPGADNQPLRTLLGPAQTGVVEICHLQGPRIVP